VAGHLAGFVARLSFILASSTFAVMFFVRFEQLSLPPHRILMVLALLFSLFCYTLELERLARAIQGAEGRRQQIHGVSYANKQATSVTYRTRFQSLALLSAVAVLTSVAGCQTPVQTKSKPGADFAAYRTFALMPLPRSGAEAPVGQARARGNDRRARGESVSTSRARKGRLRREPARFIVTTAI